MTKREMIIELAKKDPAWKERVAESIQTGGSYFCPTRTCEDCKKLFPKIQIMEGTDLSKECPCEIYSKPYLLRCVSFALRVLKEEKLI